MLTSRIIIAIALSLFIAGPCCGKELAFICESDGRTSKIEQYKQEVIEELTRRCLQGKVAANAIVDTVVDGHGQILELSLASTRLDPKVEKSLITQLKAIKFGSRLSGTGGYLKMTLRFTIDPKLWEAKAADDALMKRLTNFPSVSGKEYANQIQLVLNQRVALNKATKAMWASFGKGLPRRDTEVAWVKYVKNAEEHLALGLRARAAEEFLTASREAFFGGKPQEGEAFVGRAIALSNQMTWHQNRYIYKELCSLTGQLVNNHYGRLTKDSKEFLHRSVNSLRDSLVAREPGKQIVLLKLSNRLNEGGTSWQFICGTGRRRSSEGSAPPRKLSELESSVESCRKLANAASRSNRKQAVVELKKALKLMEFEYGKNSIECLPELCSILQLELDQAHSEEAFKTAKEIQAVSVGYEDGEEIDRTDEWGYRHGLTELEMLVQDFGWRGLIHESSTGWKGIIAEILFRSQYMLTLKTDQLGRHDTEEAVLNLCSFLAKNDKAQESINLFNQFVKACKDVDSSSIKSLTEDFAEALERAGKNEQARDVKNTIGANTKRPKKWTPQK